MYNELRIINSRPGPFQFYTADKLWADDHTSKKMLEFHLNEFIDVSSRNKDFIDRSVDWIVSHFRVGVNTRIADFGCGSGLDCNVWRVRRLGLACGLFIWRVLLGSTIEGNQIIG